MKVMVVGGGGREHALAWKLSKSPRVSRVFTAPGNAGTAAYGANVDIAADDVDGLREFALSEGMDLTVVGPELPLTLGIADDFKEAGLRVFGPSKAAAELEGSKAFSKGLMARHNIPTGFYKEFSSAPEASEYIEANSPPFVVKADGLAAGKGVVICATREDALGAVDMMINRRAFGPAGSTLIIEEFLEGEEVSILAVTDGTTVVPLAPAQDHKAIYDGDKGPNTGGMGAYSPAPVATPELEAQIMESVMVPAVEAMAAEGRPYSGVLYAGLMITGDGPKVLEFNVRFGDPEAQPIFMRLESDLFELLMAAAEGRLEGTELKWTDKASVCVVMASRGYPGAYEKGMPVRGLEEAARKPGTMVFHAGTAAKDGCVVTSGGRVLGVTALGKTIEEAMEKAYGAVDLISFEGAYCRRDIGKKALKRKSP